MISYIFQKKLTGINLNMANRLFLLSTQISMGLKLAKHSIMIVAILMSGCNSKELARLRTENDSLRNELATRHNLLTGLTDIKVLLDSIDANRNSLRSNLSEGTSYEDFTARLRDINEFVKLSEEKIDLIQNALKESKHEAGAYLMLVDALKSEVKIRMEEIVKLEEEVSRYQQENQGLQQQIRLKEDEVKDINIKISEKQQELLLLEARVEAMIKNFKVTEADAYYARARAVEEAARRTKLAPGKRRETYREALELYKRSLSLGKQEAKKDIANLEKKLK